ncbi:MAG TPA: hypothetical protein VK756_05400 [Solirubrobacteraceae bacterium]|jgi:hypothetical protein|nr:hypothetical protein [Solirubrobacteraceae bacterium]
MTGFRFVLAAVLAGLALGCPALALAQRPATPAEFAAIRRLLGPSASSLHDRLEWVHVSTRGPFALAYLTGPQEAAIVLRGAGARWASLAAISDEGLRCGLVPAAVVADLRLERYNDGPKPCSRT